jgi:hypothetical protein
MKTSPGEQNPHLPKGPHAMSRFPYKAAMLAVALTNSSLCYAGNENFSVKKIFTSPSSHHDLVVVACPSPLGAKNPPLEKIGKFLNRMFVEATNLARTVYTREYHGNGWILDQPSYWITDRYLWTADEWGLFVADAETNTILFNNVLEAYAKNPAADKWIAIRFRPSARIQEYLDEKFRDSLLLVDPANMAAQSARDLPEDSLAHVESMRVDGVALGPPEWAADGSRFAILVWENGVVSAVQYDTQLRETARTAIDLQVDRETALSVWLKKDLAPLVKRILSDSRTFESKTAVPSP